MDILDRHKIIGGKRRRANSINVSRRSEVEEDHHKWKMKLIQDKLDLMEEKDKKKKDKNRDFVKNEGLAFLENLKFFN